MLFFLTLLHTIKGEYLSFDNLQQEEYGEYLVQTISLQLSSGPTDKAIALLSRMKEQLENNSLDSQNSHKNYQNACSESLKDYHTNIKSTKLQHAQTRNNLEQWEKQQKNWRSQLVSAQKDLATYKEIQSEIVSKKNSEMQSSIEKSEKHESAFLQLEKKNSNTFEDLRISNPTAFLFTQLLENGQDLNLEEFVEYKKNAEDRINEEYFESLDVYVEEIEKEIEGLENEIADLEGNVAHWDAKVTECRAQYEETERRLEQVPKLIVEKETICKSENKQFIEKTERDQRQVLIIDSVVYLIENDLFE